MKLFNVGSFFSEEAVKGILPIINDEEKLRKRLIETKELLLKIYNFKAYNLPEDFTTSSYIIAANHLTDADAPLIMSYYYKVMHKVMTDYPQLFVFAKENCFNGVSIPEALKPILEMEKVVGVDRTNIFGSIKAMRTAKSWLDENDKPKHFLIFCQGTIYDINQDKAEDIEEGALLLSSMLGIPILPTFIEQAVEKEENRLFFGTPFSVPKGCREFDDYKKILLDGIINAQDQLEVFTGKPVREAILDDNHKVRKKNFINTKTTTPKE